MKKIHLLFYFLLAIFYTSCSEDCDTPTIIPINAHSGYVPPYTGNDTIVFLHNNTDTQIYIGSGILDFDINIPGSETKCPEKYQGASYYFRCFSNNNVIHFTYTPTVSGTHKYYFNGQKSGDMDLGLFYNVVINGKIYSQVYYSSADNDFTRYFCIRADSIEGQILKILYPGDTLTILK